MEPIDITNNGNEKMKSINSSNNKLRELKSDFFLKILFNLIPKKLSLELINYNKYLQKRIDININ